MDSLDYKLKQSTFFSDAAKDRIKLNIVTIVLLYFILWLTGLFLGRVLYEGFSSFAINKLNLERNLIESYRKILVCGVQIFVFFIWVKFFERREIKTLGFKSGAPIKSYISGMFIGFLAICLITISLFLLKLVTFIGGSQGFSFLSFIPIVVSWMIQSAAEEIAIRGWLIPKLGYRKTPFTAILITSVVFGILHLFTTGVTLLSFSNLILSGAFFAIIAIYCNGIWTVMGLHFMWNLTLGNIFGFPVSGFSNYGESCVLLKNTSASFFNGGDFGPEGGFITTLVLIAGILIISIKLYKKYK
jgi:membrane protease YdiL (CAAX protease family)